jgi:cysteine-rich repeat protein
MRRSSLGVLVIACTALATALPATAQIVVVPTFPVGPAPLNEIPLNTEVAVAADGSIVFAWTATGSPPHVSTRRMSATGTGLGAPQAIGSTDYVRGLVADPNGAYLIGLDDGGATPGGISGRRLDVLGAGSGAQFPVSDVATGSVTNLGLAALPSGAVFVWSQNSDLLGRLVDATGQPRGPSFVIADVGDAPGRSVSVAAMPSGGFVVAWSYFTGGVTAWTRVYDGNGAPEIPQVAVGPGVVLTTGVAASPLGGFMVSGFRFGVSFDGPTDAVAFHFADDGTALGTAVLDTLPSGVVALGKLAFNAAGAALAVWTEYRFAGPNPAYLRNRGRALAPDGTALALPFLIADAPVEQVRTAALPDGTFVNAWVSLGDVVGNVVRLCTADVAVCGDGVTMPQCEECDDGAANSDTTPDACRSNCARPRCGDGIVDVAHGEECDDGNADPCDGCTPDCKLEMGLVCGDGAVVPGCTTEQCDDGNQVVGDGCDPSCTIEPIFGGGSASTDCTAGWTVDNPTNVPLLDTKGQFRNVQTCKDNDPRCDFDGGVAGGCVFRVQACANLTSSAQCTPATRLRDWSLAVPSATSAARHPNLAAVRTALASVPGAIVGPSARNVCSAWLEVPVPLRRKGGIPAAAKLTLKSVADTYDGVRDSDKVKLICVP